MKVYAFDGSPQPDDNTKAAVELFLEGMYRRSDQFKGSDPALFANTFHLHWLDIQYCKHCGLCEGNGGRCIIRDDFQNFGANLASCQVLVFATPLYWFGMSAQLKKAIDRMCSAEHSAMKGKKVFLLITGDDSASEEGCRLVERQMELICEHLDMELVAAHRIQTPPGIELRNSPEQAELLQNLSAKLL